MLAVAATALLSAFTAYAQTEGFRYKENPELQKLLPNRAQTDSASYLLGVNFGMMMRQYEFKGIDYSLILNGLKDAVESKGDPTAPTFVDQFNINPMEMGRILDSYLEMWTDYNSARNEDMGKAFAEFYLKQHPDAKRTESGLIYRILRHGNGRYATSLEDTVVVDYKGFLISGEEFDANEESDFSLGVVISGWGEGLQLVDEGGSIELVIPGDLAYGEYGNRSIGPNSTLIFTVKLREVKRYVEAVESEENTVQEEEARKLNCVLFKDKEEQAGVWYSGTQENGNIMLRCGKRIDEIFYIGDAYAWERVYDCGDRVYHIEQGLELRTYVTAYDVATGTYSGGYLGENGMAEDLDRGFAVRSGGDGGYKGYCTVGDYYNFNPGMAEANALICYQFQNNEAFVCPNWGEDWEETSSGAKIPMGTQFGSDLKQWDGYGAHPTIWTTHFFEMLIHEPAKNGIATYEIICTTIHWKSNGLCNWEPEYEESIVGIDLPKTIAYGYIGLGCDYFVQPLFPEAKAFDGNKAKVRIGDKWLSMTAEEIAEYDPFIQPSEIKETTVE